MLLNIHDELYFIIHELQEYLQRIETAMKQLPSEDIHVEIKKGKKYYRCYTKNQNNQRHYLGNSSNPEVSIRLKYQVCHILYERIQQLLKRFQEIADTLPLTIDLNDLESELPDKYKEFPRELFDELQLTDQKRLIPQEKNQYYGYKKGLQHQTQSGILVRSKSEQIIADRLTYNKIPFEYEPPLANENGPETHPDFKIFIPSQNRWIYLEHFGKIKDPKYYESYQRRIQLYTDHHLLIGYDIFFTYDRPDGSIDIHALDTLISMILKII